MYTITRDLSTSSYDYYKEGFTVLSHINRLVKIYIMNATDVSLKTYELSTGILIKSSTVKPTNYASPYVGGTTKFGLLLCCDKSDISNIKIISTTPTGGTGYKNVVTEYGVDNHSKITEKVLSYIDSMGVSDIVAYSDNEYIIQKSYTTKYINTYNGSIKDCSVKTYGLPKYFNGDFYNWSSSNKKFDKLKISNNSLNLIASYDYNTEISNGFISVDIKNNIAYLSDFNDGAGGILVMLDMNDSKLYQTNNIKGSAVCTKKSVLINLGFNSAGIKIKI